jgi:hypothetical protein
VLFFELSTWMLAILITVSTVADWIARRIKAAK